MGPEFLPIQLHNLFTSHIHRDFTASQTSFAWVFTVQALAASDWVQPRNHQKDRGHC